MRFCCQPHEKKIRFFLEPTWLDRLSSHAREADPRCLTLWRQYRPIPVFFPIPANTGISQFFCLLGISGKTLRSNGGQPSNMPQNVLFALLKNVHTRSLSGAETIAPTTMRWAELRKRTPIVFLPIELLRPLRLLHPMLQMTSLLPRTF